MRVVLEGVRHPGHQHAADHVWARAAQERISFGRDLVREGLARDQAEVVEAQACGRVFQFGAEAGGLSPDVVGREGRQQGGDG